jgi:hypothetical protein
MHSKEIALGSSSFKKTGSASDTLEIAHAKDQGEEEKSFL